MDSTKQMPSKSKEPDRQRILTKKKVNFTQNVDAERKNSLCTAAYRKNNPAQNMRNGVAPTKEKSESKVSNSSGRSCNSNEISFFPNLMEIDDDKSILMSQKRIARMFSREIKKKSVNNIESVFESSSKEKSEMDTKGQDSLKADNKYLSKKKNEDFEAPRKEYQWCFPPLEDYNCSYNIDDCIPYSPSFGSIVKDPVSVEQKLLNSLVLAPNEIKHFKAINQNESTTSFTSFQDGVRPRLLLKMKSPFLDKTIAPLDSALLHFSKFDKAFRLNEDYYEGTTEKIRKLKPFYNVNDQQKNSLQNAYGSNDSLNNSLLLEIDLARNIYRSVSYKVTAEMDLESVNLSQSELPNAIDHPVERYEIPSLTINKSSEHNNDCCIETGTQYSGDSFEDKSTCEEKIEGIDETRNDVTTSETSSTHPQSNDNRSTRAYAVLTQPSQKYPLCCDTSSKSCRCYLKNRANINMSNIRLWNNRKKFVLYHNRATSKRKRTLWRVFTERTAKLFGLSKKLA